MLLQSPLYGADLHVYAVAQGPLVLGGYEAHGGVGQLGQHNSTTTARIPGRRARRARDPDEASSKTTSSPWRSARPISSPRSASSTPSTRQLGAGHATALDGGDGRVKLRAVSPVSPVELVAKLGEIDVQPSSPAKVVINERTGTIIAGGDVRLAPVAIAQGGLTIVIRETTETSRSRTPPSARDDRRGTAHGNHADRRRPAAVDDLPRRGDVARRRGAFARDLGVGPRELAQHSASASHRGRPSRGDRDAMKIAPPGIEFQKPSPVSELHPAAAGAKAEEAPAAQSGARFRTDLFTQDAVVAREDGQTSQRRGGELGGRRLLVDGRGSPRPTPFPAAGGIGLADMIAKTTTPPAGIPAAPLPSAVSNGAPARSASDQVLGASHAAASSETRSPSPEPLARDVPTTEPILAR